MCAGGSVCILFLCQPYPEHLSADVSYPVLLQTVPLGLLDQVCHRAGSTVLHHQLDGQIQAHISSQNNCDHKVNDLEGAHKNDFRITQ